VTEQVSQPAERPRSTPPVRKLAKDLGIDLEAVHGTGPRGLITRDDVLGRVGTQEPLAEGSIREPGARATRTPIRGVRKATAAAMVASAFTAPHASEFLTIDVTPAMELLSRLRESKAFAGLKLTPMTLAAKAVLIALRRHPQLNAHWDDEAQEIVQYHYVNLGFAAATPRGLLVPNVKDADAMDLAQLAEAVSHLVEAAREGRTSPTDLTGGTITITNIGVFGVDAGTPILNPGEAAILAIGQVRRMPWEYHGEVALREVVTLSLSFDHRLVDGEQASRFLADVGAIMADPGMVLALV
jgi:pyruvate dehydrogenase E2 component (dihydrolipoamide acetyltransferase)